MREDDLLLESVDIYDMSPVIGYLKYHYNVNENVIPQIITVGCKRVIQDLGHMVESYVSDGPYDEWDSLSFNVKEIQHHSSHILRDVLYSALFTATQRWSKLGGGELQKVNVVMKGSRLNIKYYLNIERKERWIREHLTKSI